MQPSLFSQKLKIRVINLNEMDMEFDIVGVDPSIPNALRRILISEVPTMAFDKIFLFNNTSIIQDEVLTHRLGLIPLRADPRMFEFRQEGKRNSLIYTILWGMMVILLFCVFKFPKRISKTHL